MDLHLEGATKFNASREAVFRQLTDPRRLAESIPGRIDVRVLDDTRIQAKVAEGGRRADGPLVLELSVEESRPLDGARLVTKGSGARGTLTVTSSFGLMGDDPTWITWSADAEVGGDIENIGPSELKSLADKKAEEILGQIGRAVEAPE